MHRWLRKAGTALSVWRNNRRSPREIEAQQRVRFAALLEFARARSPFYKKLYEKLPDRLDDVRRLPPVTKSKLMACFDDWVTDPEVTQEGLRAFLVDDSKIGQLFLQKYTACFTSGTTGVHAMFLQDQNSMEVSWAVTVVRGLANLARVRRSAGAGPKKRSASVLATGGSYPAYAITERVRRHYPRLTRNSRTFSVLAPLSELVRELNEFQPGVLNGYPNAVTVLAHEQQAGRLRISPYLVVTFSETLTDSARDLISRSFGCEVRSWYGAAEAQSIAYDCGQGWLHLNADWLLLEPVDEQYRPVPIGQESDTVLLTNLANRVQPIIRYDLGDRIVFKPKRCSCGSPLPAIRAAGRLYDIPVFTSPEGEQYKVMPVLLDTVCFDTPGMQLHQIVQTTPATLIVRFEARPGADRDQVWENLSTTLRDRLADQGVCFVDLVLDPAPPRPDPTSGKFRHVAVEMAERRSGFPRA